MENSNGNNPYSAPPFQEPVPGPKPDEKLDFPLATRGKRFMGYLIDSLIMVVVFLPIAYGLEHFVWGVFSGFMDGLSDLGYEVFSTLLGLLIASLIFICVNGHLLAKNGQTLGKLLMKTRIVSNRGELLSLPSVFLRRYLFLWCVASIPVIGPIINVANCLAIFRASHKCCHDDWAGTKVVSTSK